MLIAEMPCDGERVIGVAHAAEEEDLLAAYFDAARGAFSPNTERALRADVEIFAAWCRHHLRVAVPASAATVVAFIDDRARVSDDVLAMFARLGVPVIDGHAAFVDTGQAPDDFFYFLGSHYSPAGYQVIAEAVLRTLQERLAAAEPTSSAPSPRQ